MIFFEILYTFFKIGLFSFGGGYGMLSVIQGEVVTRHSWLTMSEFTDIVAISQMTPGPIGINSATFVGYTAVVNSGGTSLMGVIGAVIASLAVMLPSFIIMLILSKLFFKYSKSLTVNSVLAALRLVVVGLIASAALLLMNAENYGTIYGEPVRFVVSIAITISAFVAFKVYKVSPILILLLSGVFGGLFFSFF